MIKFSSEKIYVKKVCMFYSLFEKGKLDIFEPKTQESVNFKNWHAQIDYKTSERCCAMDGKIYWIYETPDIEPPLHNHCRCSIISMKSIVSGNATKDGTNGADYWIKHYGKLPDYYTSKQDFKDAGWHDGKPPVRYIPDKMMGGDIYNNDELRLPDSPGRIWYEADINYYEGRRNLHRLVWSNDGLVFVTYDHYKTFYEII